MDVLIALAPPLTAVVIALLTRRVNLSLFFGIWIGGWLVTGNPLAAIGQTFTWFAEVMTDEWNARFLVLTSLLGAGAAFMYKTGGSHAVARWLESKVSTSKGTLLVAWLLGMLIFFNDYVNSIIVGNATRDVTARQKVSREKLAWVLDSTSAPMATLGPVSDWIGYQVSLIAAALVSLSLVDAEPYWIFLQSIPWNFYALLCLASVPMIILMGDFGPMHKAESRAASTGELVAPDDTPLMSVEGELGELHTQKGRLWHFLLPLAVLIGVSGWAMWYTGGGMEGKPLMDAIADTNVAVALSWAAFAMTLTGLGIAIMQRMSLEECENTLLAGFRMMLPALVIIILAWTIGTVTVEMNAGELIVDATRDWLSPSLLPILIFAISMAISFATGTSWGAMAILTPIAVPLAYNIGDMTLVQITIGAIFSGSIFGDHCSPISDTTVMSSIFAGSDHIAHVRTQIPYALVPASISGVLYCLSIVLDSPYLLLAIGFIAQVILIWGLTRFRHQTGRSRKTESDRVVGR